MSDVTMCDSSTSAASSTTVIRGWIRWRRVRNFAAPVVRRKDREIWIGETCRLHFALQAQTTKKHLQASNKQYTNQKTVVERIFLKMWSSVSRSSLETSV